MKQRNAATAKKNPVKPKLMTESQLQSICVRWFRVQYQNIVIFAIPNAAKRSFRLAAKMKAEGMVSGIPDLFIAKAILRCNYGKCGKIYHGLFIELKRSKSEKPTDNQVYYLQKLKEAGYQTAVCHSFEEFQQTVNDYLK